MRISVTGANGFLGQKIVKLLDGQGHHVIAWMRDPPMSSYTRDCRSFDLEKPESINFDGSNVVIHCAAYLPSNYEDVSEAKKCLLINGIGTLEVLKKAESAGVKKFVHLSTGQIYDWKGPIANASEEDKMDQVERATPYLVSKWVGDVYVRAHKGNMKTVVLRPSYIYGPGMKPKGLLQRMYDIIQSNNESIDMKKIGFYNVDLVYVEDVAKMTSLSATNDNILGVYNVGGSAVNTRQLLWLLADVMGKELPTLVDSEIELEKCHPSLNISKAKQVGYTTTSIRDGLKQYWKSL